MGRQAVLVGVGAQPGQETAGAKMASEAGPCLSSKAKMTPVPSIRRRGKRRGRSRRPRMWVQMPSTAVEGVHSARGGKAWGESEEGADYAEVNGNLRRGHLPTQLSSRETSI